MFLGKGEDATPPASPDEGGTISGEARLSTLDAKGSFKMGEGSNCEIKKEVKGAPSQRAISGELRMGYASKTF